MDRKFDISWLPVWYPKFMLVCKTLMVLLVFIVSSIMALSSVDIIWDCMWCLSLIKLVELSD